MENSIGLSYCPTFRFQMLTKAIVSSTALLLSKHTIEHRGLLTRLILQMGINIFLPSQPLPFLPWHHSNVQTRHSIFSSQTPTTFIQSKWVSATSKRHPSLPLPMLSNPPRRESVNPSLPLLVPRQHLPTPTNPNSASHSRRSCGK